MAGVRHPRGLLGRPDGLGAGGARLSRQVLPVRDLHEPRDAGEESRGSRHGTARDTDPRRRLAEGSVQAVQERSPHGFQLDGARWYALGRGRRALDGVLSRMDPGRRRDHGVDPSDGRPVRHGWLAHHAFPRDRRLLGSRVSRRSGAGITATSPMGRSCTVPRPGGC